METQAESKVSFQQTDLDNVLEKINEIAKESADDDYIYRGESACHQEPPHCGKVSSGLYRESHELEAEQFDVTVVQQELLRQARKYTLHKMDDFEILTTLQHYGDNTNLIDFTTDYLVALFFACDGKSQEPGRVILLQRQSKVDPNSYKVKKPPRTIRRAEDQKSIFVQTEEGFVEPDKVVCIPADLKRDMLDYLRRHHNISAKTIYNDLHGFIERRKLHKDAYAAFQKGLTFRHRAASAKTKAERQECYDKAIIHYTEAINLNLEYTSAYNNRGIIYAGQGNFDMAIRDYKRAIDLDPEDARFYNNRGNAYRDIGDFAAAIEDYSKAIDLAPEDASAYNNRGVAYRDTDDFDAAIADYNKAIDLDPEDARFYNNRGVAYRDTDDFDAAIADYNKAIDLDPEDARFYNNRGVAYRDTGDFGAAIADYTEAIDLDPEDASAYNNRGVAYRDTDDFGAAIADFNKAIDLDPEYAKAYNNRGNAYCDQGDFGAAIADYTKAIDLAPEDARLYNNRGEAWLHLKEWQKAETDLMAAKDMDFDIIASFQNDYESVEDFEARNEVKVPKDIAALLLRK